MEETHPQVLGRCSRYGGTVAHRDRGAGDEMPSRAEAGSRSRFSSPWLIFRTVSSHGRSTYHKLLAASAVRLLFYASAGERQSGRAGGLWEGGLRANAGAVTCEWATLLLSASWVRHAGARL